MSIVARYPDKPMQRMESALDKLDNGRCMAQLKMNGYRCLAAKENGTITLYSSNLRPLAWANADVITEVSTLPIPDGTVLDGELLGRRQGTREQSLHLFGVLWLSGEWQGDIEEVHRWEWLQEKLVDWQGTHVHLVTCWEKDFKLLYEQHRDKTETIEGVVVKYKSAKLVGNRKTQAKNGRWVKVKYNPYK